ncbi:MAG: hypothetical protein LBJ32_01230 [Oscillospiraceae bacterium]|nr:hypothetical protein [Oscillospiraceae bacterium]
MKTEPHLAENEKIDPIFVSETDSYASKGEGARKKIIEFSEIECLKAYIYPLGGLQSLLPFYLRTSYKTGEKIKHYEHLKENFEKIFSKQPPTIEPITLYRFFNFRAIYFFNNGSEDLKNIDNNIYRSKDGRLFAKKDARIPSDPSIMSCTEICEQKTSFMVLAHGEFCFKFIVQPGTKCIRPLEYLEQNKEYSFLNENQDLKEENEVILPMNMVLTLTGKVTKENFKVSCGEHGPGIVEREVIEVIAAMP